MLRNDKQESKIEMRGFFAALRNDKQESKMEMRGFFAALRMTNKDRQQRRFALTREFPTHAALNTA